MSLNVFDAVRNGVLSLTAFLWALTISFTVVSIRNRKYDPQPTHVATILIFITGYLLTAAAVAWFAIASFSDDPRSLAVFASFAGMLMNVASMFMLRRDVIKNYRSNVLREEDIKHKVRKEVIEEVVQESDITEEQLPEHIQEELNGDGS